MTNKALKILCLGILVLMLGIPSLAQNTKGDRPAPASRETRFKTPKKSKQKSQPSRRVRGDDRPGQRFSTPPRRTREGERPGKPVTPQFSRSKPRGESQKAWRGDISGRRITPRKETGRAMNVYPQPGTTNYSSRTPRRTERQNQNPNVQRVRRMQDRDSSKPRVGRPIRPVFHKTKPQQSERAWRGDITGRSLRASITRRARPSSEVTPARMSGSRPQRIQRFGGLPPRISGRARNVYRGNSFYVNNQSRKTPRFQSEGSRVALNMLGRYNERTKGGGKGGKIVPRSASAAYIARRSTNTWAHFPRPKRKQHAYTRDLAGKKLRTKNFETQRPVLINPTTKYQRRMAGGERPYQGPAAGGHLSRSRTGRAWLGDIAGRAIRGGFRSKKGEPKVGNALVGRGPRGGRADKYQGNIRTGRRGFGNQGEEYTGNIRAGKPFKGGGSISGGWNNKGLPIQRKTPGKGSQRIGYAGNVRAGRRIFRDQGEEYSGNIRSGKRGFGDQGEEYTGNIKRGRRGFGDQGEEYTGNIKRGRRGFGDQGEEYTGNIKRGRRGFGDQGEEYTGNIKRGRRGFSDQGEEYTGNIKGGRRGFNDQGEEYTGNIRAGQRGFSDQGEEYTGNIKSHRFLKGGGSRSGKLWNNNNTPILVRTPHGKSARIAGYQGNIKAGGRILRDQGEEYTGNIKASRPQKGGGSVSGKLWNNNQQAIDGKAYVSQKKISRFSGTARAQRPDKGGGSVSGQMWNNNEKAILVKTPKETEERNFMGNLKVSRSNYRRNPNAAEDALPVLKASAANVKAGQYSRGVRRDWDYVRNPSSANEAQRTREPGRAFGRSGDFQGNIRIKRFDLFDKNDLHPDARFVKLNKNNVAEEKDMLTNFKLWWARLFKKAETQPDHLKENDKDRKPRYDKGEAGLWYE